MEIDFLIGLAAGIIATFVFQFLLLQKKPKVVLAQQVSMETLNTSPARYRYSFKAQNKGRHQVVDITLRAWLCELESVEGNEVSKGVYEFSINNSETRTLAPNGKSNRPWGLTSEAEFSAESDQNILQFLSSRNHLIMITFKARDAISGTTLVLQQTYGKRDVVEGIFGFRERMVVVR